MGIGVWMKTNLFKLGRTFALFLFFFFFLFFVIILAEITYFAYGRFGIRGYFDKIQLFRPGKL